MYGRTSGTQLVDCASWAESGSWAVPPSAVSGLYFARLTRDDHEAAEFGKDGRNWRADASAKLVDWTHTRPGLGDKAFEPPLRERHAYGRLV